MQLFGFRSAAYSLAEGRVNLLGRVGLHAQYDMAVDVERDANRRVAEPLTRHLGGAHRTTAFARHVYDADRGDLIRAGTYC